jgi:hypothetical protein
MDNAKADALGVSAKARHGLPSVPAVLEPQSLGHHSGLARQHGRNG